MLAERINAYLVDPCGLDPARPAVIGVSGGADSLALLYLLVELGWAVAVAHFNHHLRPDADADALFVAQTAAQLGVPYHHGEGDVATLAAEKHLSVETAARKARYDFLFGVAGRIGAQAVITAHHADDQAETVLMHVLRGAGLTGLRGMQPRTFLREFSPDIPLVRPFLSTWRVEIDAYCREHGLSPQMDATNADPAYFRNRVRQELIPFLEGYNPQVRQHLAGLAANASRAIKILEPAVHQAYDRVLISAGEGYRRFDRVGIQGLSAAMQMEVIRQAAAGLLPAAEDVDQAALERAASVLALAEGSRRAELADGLTAEVSGRFFSIFARGADRVEQSWPAMGQNQPLELVLPGRTALHNGWEIQSEWVEPGSVFSPISGDANLGLLDAGSLKLPLRVRTRRPGDRFHPLGLAHGSVSLGDFFTNEKMAREARSTWPLVVSNGEIVWVPGYRIAEPAKVHENSRSLVRLRLVKSG